MILLLHQQQRVCCCCCFHHIYACRCRLTMHWLNLQNQNVAIRALNVMWFFCDVIEGDDSLFGVNWSGWFECELKVFSDNFASNVRWLLFISNVLYQTSNRHFLHKTTQVSVKSPIVQPFSGVIPSNHASKLAEKCFVQQTSVKSSHTNRIRWQAECDASKWVVMSDSFKGCGKEAIKFVLKLL